MRMSPGAALRAAGLQPAELPREALQRWLLDQGVDVRFGHRVTDIDFDQADPARRRATRLHVLTREGPQTIALAEGDACLVTLGSITADATYGSNSDAPELIRDRRDGAWSLWETLARKADDFGRPHTFFNVDDNKWESFTLTLHGRTLLDRIARFSGNEPGTGALMTFVDSNWLMSLVVPYQPHFPNMPPDTFTAWGYGLFIDAPGNHVQKPMAQCSGRELLQELLHHLRFDDIRDEALASTDVTPVMLPYASAMFAPRKTPRDVIVKLHGVLQKILNDAEVRQQYAVQGLSPLGSASPDEFEKFYYAEYDRVARVVKIAGVKPE